MQIEPIFPQAVIGLNKIETIDNFLSKEDCDKLIEKFKEYEGKHRKFLKRYLLPLLDYADDYFFDQIIKKYKIKNKNIKNIELLYWPIGEFHNWHDDSKYYDYTTITYLNDGYVGGRTIIKNNEDDVEIEPKIGKYVGFESSMKHKVTELLEGPRFVLICWY